MRGINILRPSPSARPGEGPGVRGQSPREEKIDDFASKMAIFQVARPKLPGSILRFLDWHQLFFSIISAGAPSACPRHLTTSSPAINGQNVNLPRPPPPRQRWSWSDRARKTGRRRRRTLKYFLPTCTSPTRPSGCSHLEHLPGLRSGL